MSYELIRKYANRQYMLSARPLLICSLLIGVFLFTGCGAEEDEEQRDPSRVEDTVTTARLNEESQNSLIYTLDSPTDEEGENVNFGFAATNTGDVNGDGQEDILVGALSAPHAGISEAGQVYLFSGANGNLLRTFGSPNPEEYGEFGEAVSAIRDVNDDAAPDVLVGAPSEDVDGSHTNGRVYLLNGANGDLLWTVESPDPEKGSGFGSPVAQAGDVNGDGVTDILVGENRGAHLFSGSDGDHIRSFTSPSPEVGSGFGESIAGGSDVSGDGIPDVLVGASMDDQGAKVYVFSGSDASHLRTLESPNPKGDADFGTSVAWIEDLDGDRTPDVLVGAQGESAVNTVEAGRAYVFSGADGDLHRTLVSPNVEEEGAFGSTVVKAGDVNDDGVMDVFVGAREETVPRRDAAGRAYIFSGATSRWLRVLEHPRAEDEGLMFGTALSGIQDANGDDTTDLLVGQDGRAYLFSGSRDVRPVLPLRRLVVEQGNWNVLTKPLKTSHLYGLDKDELRILRHTPLAHHGKAFTDDRLTKHFSQFGWYEPQQKEVESQLTKAEQSNVDLVEKIEKNYDRYDPASVYEAIAAGDTSALGKYADGMTFDWVYDGVTPVMHALRSLSGQGEEETLEIVRFLVENGADPARGGAVTHAVVREYSEIAKYLLAQGASGSTPAYIAGGTALSPGVYTPILAALETNQSRLKTSIQLTRYSPRIREFMSSPVGHEVRERIAARKVVTRRYLFLEEGKLVRRESTGMGASSTDSTWAGYWEKEGNIIRTGKKTNEELLSPKSIGESIRSNTLTLSRMSASKKDSVRAHVSPPVVERIRVSSMETDTVDTASPKAVVDGDSSTVWVPRPPSGTAPQWTEMELNRRISIDGISLVRETSSPKSAQPVTVELFDAVDSDTARVTVQGNRDQPVQVSGSQWMTRFRVVAKDGSGTGSTPTRFPDVAFTRDHQRVVLQFPDDLTYEAAAHTRSGIAPSDEKILFVTERDGNAEVYRMNGNGTNPLNLTQNESTDHDVAWSWATETIAFASDRGGSSAVYTMGLDGDNVTRISKEGRSCQAPAWSPDGEKLAFLCGAPDLLSVAHLADGERKLVSTEIDVLDRGGLPNPTLAEDADGSVAAPQWSKKHVGVRIAYLDKRNNVERVGHTFFTPQGDRLTRASNVSPEDEGTLSEQLKSRYKTFVSSHPGVVSQPSPASNDSSVVLVSDGDGDREIYRLPLNGRGLYYLTDNAAADYNPVVIRSKR